MLNLRNTPIKATSLLSFIFFFSGFASLIYQVVWQRLLTVYYGVGVISIIIIVSIYMLGLGGGALLGGFLSERIRNKISLYCVVELLIGCFGLISLPFLTFLGRYTAGSSYLISFLCMCLFLFLPTLLMGITLPLLTKIFNSLLQNFLDTVSFLYFINTIGAALGAVFTSYGIISFFGLDTAIYFDVTINFILTVLIFFARYFSVSQREQEFASVLQQDGNAISCNAAYLLVFITGFLAIGYEIVWFRIVGVLVKDSSYAFSTVLSVYLLGIALGSFGMSKYLKKHKDIDKKSLFFFLQFCIGIYVAAALIGYYYLTKYTFLGFFTEASFSIDLHPSFRMPSFLSTKDFLKDIYLLIDVFLWPMIFVFVPTIFMGAGFPLISLLALSQHNKEGKTVGTVYFFNITGNVLGGIFTGFLLLAYLGTEITILVFSLIGIFSGLFVSRIAGRQMPILKRLTYVFILLIAAAIFFPERGQLYEAMHFPPDMKYKTYMEEGMEGIVMTYQYHEKVVNYINGLGHGGRPNYSFYAEAIEAVSFSPKVENILIVGYGTGSFVETILRIEGVRKVTIVELNNTLIRNLRKMAVFDEMLSDKRINLIMDDGRRFLLRTDEKFDLILMDPLRTTTSYSNNLYSRQFFELANQHLNHGGILLVWMDEYKVIPKTILSV